MIIGRYRVLGQIGQGGMGVVYKAIDGKLGRIVALKLLPPLYAEDQGRRRRFMREARSAAAVTHASIATIHEVDEADGRIYIVMEYVEGRSLRATLAAGRLSIAEAIRIALAMARGLVKAHDRGIVHRDLKPDNVMLGADGEVKILDFGLAKLRETDPVLEHGESASKLTPSGEVPGTLGHVSSEHAVDTSVDARSGVFPGQDLEHAEAPSQPTDTSVDARSGVFAGQDPGHAGAPSRLTQVGQVLGTPGYMSPEQATGQSVDARSDIFSLGVVLYEMLSGTRPFKGETTGDVRSALSRGAPEPLVKHNAEVPPELQRVVDRCLARRPEARYGSARELVSALEGVAGQPGSGITSGIRRAPTLTASKRRVPLVVGLGIVLLGGTSLVAIRCSAPSAPTSSSSHSTRADLASSKLPSTLPNAPAPPRVDAGVTLDDIGSSTPVKGFPSARPLPSSRPRPVTTDARAPSAVPPSATPQVSTMTPSSTAPPASTPQQPPKLTCTPPKYTINDSGDHIPKPECL